MRLDVKTDPSPMSWLAHSLSRRLVPHLPDWLMPNQITALGLGCLAMAGLAFYLGSFDRRWMLLGVAGVFGHLFTDHLDGNLARMRGLTSERGFFLDLFSDAVGITCLLLGLAFAHYTAFVPFTLYLAVAQLRMILLLHWIMLRRVSQLPWPGLSDAPLLVSVLTALTFAYDGPLLSVAGRGLGWWDLAALLLTLVLLVEGVGSAVRLARRLEPAQRREPNAR